MKRNTRELFYFSQFKLVLFLIKITLKFINSNLSSLHFLPHYICLKNTPLPLLPHRLYLKMKSLILCANIAQHELPVSLFLPLPPLTLPLLLSQSLSHLPPSLSLIPPLVLANHCATRREICKQCLLKQPKSMQRARAR